MTTVTTALIYSDEWRHFDYGSEHPLRMERLGLTWRLMEAYGLTALPGAKVLAPAFDVFDAGRMSVLQDPTGAIFTVWQAKKNAGIGIVRSHGAFCWADLTTSGVTRTFWKLG